MNIGKQYDHGLRWSRDTSVNIVTGYRLEAGVNSQEEQDLSLLHSIKIVSKAHPMGLGGKAAGT
jgi:hypothetical protein